MLTEKKVDQLKQIARKIRITALKMMFEAGSGHLASAMSVVELLTTLYFSGILNYDAQNPQWPERDYFLLSNGHACPSFYALLASAGYFSPLKLKNQLFKLNTGLQGHPLKGSLPGIEISSGSLGMGLSVGLGIALGLKQEKRKNKVIVMMSDGEQQEGSTWEAVMAASHYKLSNLTAVIDRNGIQIAGRTEKNIKLEPLDQKYLSFGWQVIKIDGHNFKAIYTAFQKAFALKKPVVIIAKTIPAKDVYKLEGREDTHHPKLKKEIYQQTLKILKSK